MTRITSSDGDVPGPSGSGRLLIALVTALTVLGSVVVVSSSRRRPLPPPASSGVYFEPMNEPHGYSSAEWRNVAAAWLSYHYSAVPGRTLIGGTGFSQDLRDVCNDGRFGGTLLSFHHYAFFYGAMGGTYWPAIGGKPTGSFGYDHYSMFSLTGSGTNLNLAVRNTSGRDRIRYGWGL